ncbi:hypothetical protein OG689_11025 [Kitasatospora sp. NBC_00240]|uniref:hypothetical protein n=1 Tax=Kitasatospora sp. NBC_00240 TaxID=2903567 RepID=UPI002251BBF3|nr:hypothetical protein [Kitasatospora sp. NBC_00240]MCX5209817.1 hypothetical protein [Kitasatospora sp. NBC_00240]
MPAPKTPPTGEPEPTADVAPEPPAAFEYIAPFATVYLAVPLTARPAQPGLPATDEDPGTAATPATVFAWPDGAPDDGRWTATRKKPNQQPDNMPAEPRPEA